MRNSVISVCRNRADLSSYHLQWWTAEQPPFEDDILHLGSVTECVEYHRLLTRSGGVLPIRGHKKRYDWPLESMRPVPTPNLACQRCRLYCGVTASMLQDSQDLRHHVHRLEVCYQEHTG